MQDIGPIVSHRGGLVKSSTTPRERISTGWLSVDKVLDGGLADELYVIGGETSTGKSAFAMSMAQNIAKQGVDVLFFSLGMGEDEHIARGISSLSFQYHMEDKDKRCFTAGDILYFSHDKDAGNFVQVPYQAYEEYAEEYFATYGDHLYIVEIKNGIDARTIAEVSMRFMEMHQKKVVVFVDYLQALQADDQDRSQTDRKTKIDSAVTTLKSLSATHKIPVIAISAVNRASYKNKISTSAYKESGDTEYTGGVLIGWNWKGVTGESSEHIEIEKESCTRKGYREMEFDVLKFRNSQCNRSVPLMYYPAYNHFCERNGTDNEEIVLRV